MNPFELPSHVWAWSSAVIVAVIASITGWLGHVIGARKNKDDRLDKLVDQLQEEIERLSERVERLEHTRDAYRSWSIVLWEWGLSAQSETKPLPLWPTDLPR